MSIWNKILLALIAVASLAFFYFATRTLKTHQYWRDLARDQQAQIEMRKQIWQVMKDGGELQLEGLDPDATIPEGVELTRRSDGRVGVEGKVEGIRQLGLKLHAILVDRGRAWFNCMPQGAANEQSGRVLVKTEPPGPHRIAKESVLCVFEEMEVQQGQSEKGHYLGQFNVVEVTNEDDEVALKPIRKMTALELDRLVQSKGPWTLYEKMPVDNHYIFADLEDDELKAMLPEDSVAEYVKDGKGTFVRKLRDYEVLFGAFHVQRSILIDLIEADTRDKQYVENAYNDAQVQIQSREKEVRDLTADKKTVEGERSAVSAHRKLLESRAAGILASVEKLIAANKAMAAQIARIQKDAAKQIDERTRRMAQSRSGGN